MRHLAVTIVLLYLASCNIGQDESRSWQSNFRTLSFIYRKPLTLLPTLDTKDKTLTGVIDQNDGTSIIIQITDDIPGDRLSNHSYFNGVRKTMLGADSRNSLISEDTIIFHKKEAMRQIYLMYTQKWGLLKQENVVIRTGKEFVSVQFLYPVRKEKAKEENLPENLKAFDKALTLEVQ